MKQILTGRNFVLLAIGFGGLVVFWQYSGGPTGTSNGALASVTVPALSVADKLGEAAFNRNCASCHGPNAAGRDGLAPPLIHKIYEPGHHGDRAFQLAAMRGVRAHHWPFGNMPPVEGISTTDVSRIIAYVRTLQRANGIN